jgi:glutamate/tyrosine decarboxylase-like PLP-dependent enzyme
MSAIPLPKSGANWKDLASEMQAMTAEDADWRGLKTAVYVFNAGEEVRRVGREAYMMFISENGLAPKAFPSLHRMEQEVVGFGLGLMDGEGGGEGEGEGGAGCMTAGGSESIFMAMKSARDWARGNGRKGSEVVAPSTAHPAFNKAAHTLGLTVKRIPVAADFRADVSAMEAAVSEESIMLVGSAPCFPYGLIDPIADLDGVAARTGLWLHVDACVGGYFIPHAERQGAAIDPWDFRLPHVSSISADLHKYGYTPKGASTVLYRSEDLFAHQAYTFDVWPCGSMSTPTVNGTRPGGAIAGAWAVLRHLGRDGYERLAADVMNTRQAIQDGAAALGFETVGDPKLGLIALHHPQKNTHAIADAMRAKGWISARTAKPDAIHLMLQPAHVDAVEAYLIDLKATTAAAPVGGESGVVTYN